MRQANCLNNLNIRNKSEALEAYKIGTLDPTKPIGIKPYGYGPKTHAAVMRWINTPKGDE